MQAQGAVLKMTRLSATCTTIQPACVEVPMVCGGSNGVGASSLAIRPRFHPNEAGRFALDPVNTLLWLRTIFAVMLAVLLFTACSAVPVFAQNEQSDVHVAPREQKNDAKPDPTVMPPAIAAEAKAAGVSVDPSLKTHTKPIRKDVDLVLVPVTVTDPMNRLVTGLEKDNFLLTDSGQPQEIKHFSSPVTRRFIGSVTVTGTRTRSTSLRMGLVWVFSDGSTETPAALASAAIAGGITVGSGLASFFCSRGTT